MTLRKTTVRDADGTLYVIPNSQITTVANLSAGFSAGHRQRQRRLLRQSRRRCTKLLQQIRHGRSQQRRVPQTYSSTIPQILGVDAIKGSQMIFPVVFKTRATQQYGPMREFQRRVRLALEEHHLLPGDPNRVYRPSADSAATVEQPPRDAPAPALDPTTLQPKDENPFSGN